MKFSFCVNKDLVKKIQYHIKNGVDIACYIICATYAIYYVATMGQNIAPWVSVMAYVSAAILYLRAFIKFVQIAILLVQRQKMSRRKE